MSEAAAGKRNKISTPKLLLVGLAVAVMGSGGAGAAWYFMSRSAHAETHAAQKAPPKKPLFTTLEPFTVNLLDPRGERFAQIGVTLEYDDPAVEAQIKDRLPAVRNGILMLISSKQIDELLTVEGKQQLAAQIRERATRALGSEAAAPAPARGASATVAQAGPIRDVLFSQFIVQ